jgi:NADPH-dependent glutamate synthase beta subunit-like oxidoreductase/dihydroorotate dehydrogenase/Pyruvate/2-oxoacid:ferredoxin oxidoreductase delta subunit
MNVEARFSYGGPFLTEAQFRAEIRKCEYCEEKPCRDACPCDCSPADFIKAAEMGAPSDFRRSAALIMSKNPLGGICGMVCPDKFCMAACVHKKLDGAVRIPEVQAFIIEKARKLAVMPVLDGSSPNGRRVAVIGSGPAGLGAAATLAQRGYAVTVHEREGVAGGMCHCIPDFRLVKDVLAGDVGWGLSLGGIRLELNHGVTDPLPLLKPGGFDAVVVATGLWTPVRLGVRGEEAAVAGIDFLRRPSAHDVSGRVAVVGGGATAFDCAMVAKERGATHVEIFALEKLSEMPLSAKERDALVESGIELGGRVRIASIESRGGRVSGVRTVKVRLRPDAPRFHPRDVEDVPGTEAGRNDIDAVIVAIGLRSDFPRVDDPRIVYAGDCIEGPTTVVEASASGKNAADQVDALLAGRPVPSHRRNESGHVKSRQSVAGYRFLPVPLETDFFGRRILSPFLISASPPSDGYDQMRKAYEAGWAGAIMKTAFDGVPIHIPGEYMFAFDEDTYANCDNVSGHALDRVCREIEDLVRAYPDRLTIASTGGPVSGDDESDRRQWQGNTRKLERAGAMAIEYSLSCPQGGDGTEGDIVSQNAQLTAKIIDWILQSGEADVPKLFKLTGAVTSVAAIVGAVKQVLDRHPGKKAGITLANSFPTLAFRRGAGRSWDDGVIVGASGAGILNISYLSLAKVAHLGVAVSGNGGPMDYSAAANFLALGARTVQFCTLVMKYGYGIVDDMHAGLSHLLAERGLSSVGKLIGIALPDPVADFMALSPVKKISSADRDLCLRCGNCARCPYLAIAPDADGYPVTAADRCVGCGICSLKCFSLAITMRERTPEETAALRED